MDEVTIDFRRYKSRLTFYVTSPLEGTLGRKVSFRRVPPTLPLETTQFTEILLSFFVQKFSRDLFLTRKKDKWVKNPNDSEFIQNTKGEV